MNRILLILLLGIYGNLKSQAPPFVVQTPTGGWYLYSQQNVNDSLVTASLSVAGDVWALAIKAKTNVSAIRFPYETNRQSLDGNLADDIYYYPVLGGGTVQAPAHNVDWNWYGLQYPGELFAPLVITADPDDARIVAATNWPPRAVVPSYAAERVQMAYENIDMGPGDSTTLSCLIASVIADTLQGEKAWQEALDRYRGWLDQHLSSPVYPPAMVDAHGYFYIGLTDWPAFDLTEISTTWAQWRDRLPWMQIWGQMSNYAGPPHLAVPPLQPGEITDCCYPEYDMHPRYLPALVDFMEDSVVGLGYLGGYYSSPFHDIWHGSGTYLLDTQMGIDWLAGWLDRNEFTYKANAFYVDILGRRYWGEPATIMSHFNGTFIRDMTIIEGMVDIYPAAGLLSGNLVGMAGFPGGPNITPENSVEAAFPAMQRYLLNDRIAFMGPSNGDAVFMGPTADYWLVRQAFILGAKFEVSHPNDNWDPNTPNPMLTLAIQERDRVNWWQRSPRYWDTKGIRNVPAGIEVRRFVDSTGCNLFVVDNWSALAGQSFDFQGQSLLIPATQLSIIEHCLTGSPEDANLAALNFVIYPNPAASEIRLQLDFVPRAARAAIYNGQGQLVKEVGAISQEAITIDLRELNSGMYFIELRNGDAFLGVRKLILSK